jgi:hypothetical protein
MIRKGLVWGTVSILIAVFVYWGTSFGAKDCGGMPAERVADMVHAVIESHRTFYTVHVVERLQAKGIVVASEHWESENTLPLPVHFLQESARLAVNTPAKIGYKLISLWPINKRNGPKTEFEQKGLMETLRNPDRPYTEGHAGGSPVSPSHVCRQGCFSGLHRLPHRTPGRSETELQAE